MSVSQLEHAAAGGTTTCSQSGSRSGKQLAPQSKGTKTTKALGLTVPLIMEMMAGEAIEIGLVAIGDSLLVSHRKPIILAAAENKVPAIYFHAVFARDGGLLSYGPDNADIFRRAASYVDRILRGASPAELPVQVPIKFETVINLKTAKALGLTVPLTLQVAATEVIE